MSTGRCPYHVRQGVVGSDGAFILSDICGVKTAERSPCECAQGTVTYTYKSCSRFIIQQKGGERQVLFPKNDIEFLPEIGGSGGFSEMEIM